MQDFKNANLLSNISLIIEYNAQYAMLPLNKVCID